MLDILTRQSLLWIAGADSGLDNLSGLGRTLFSIPSEEKFWVWHPSTTRAACLFLYDGLPTLVSAGVENSSVSRFLQGWVSTTKYPNGFEVNSATADDILYVFGKSYELFGRVPQRYIGHSAGGSLAAAAAHAAVAANRTNTKVDIVTFGSPSVMAGTIPTLPLASVYLRLISALDPVPGLPFTGRDLSPTGRSLIVGVAGESYRPNRFVHGRQDSFVKGDTPALLHSSTPPVSTTAATASCIAWLTGVDEHVGYPHKSSTYVSRFTQEAISDALLQSITPTIEQDEPTPYDSRLLTLETALTNNHVLLEMVLSNDAAENEWLEADVENFPQRFLGGVAVDTNGFNVRSKKGKNFVRFGDIELSQHDNRGNAMREMRTLRRLHRQLGQATQNDPNNLAWVVNAIAS